jgi:hypothetical protein
MLRKCAHPQLIGSLALTGTSLAASSEASGRKAARSGSQTEQGVQERGGPQQGRTARPSAGHGQRVTPRQRTGGHGRDQPGHNNSKNFLEVRSAGGVPTVGSFRHRPVAVNPDVLIVAGPRATQALKSTTATFRHEAF